MSDLSPAIFVPCHLRPLPSSVLLQAVCDMEVTAEKNRIRNSSISGQIKTEKLRHIDSLQGNLSYSLRQNAGFILQNTQVYQNIKADLTAL